jgi:hypothetical protein
VSSRRRSFLPHIVMILAWIMQSKKVEDTMIVMRCHVDDLSIWSVHVQADADWGGDPNRKSMSGVIVWVKAITGKWYMVQSVSRPPWHHRRLRQS